MLGEHIGKGSSRAVFQIDDQWCLKLAINAKGIAQNEAEYNISANDTYGLFPEVDNCAEDYSWVVSEFVLPAEAQDFKECLGISYKEYKDFIIYIANLYNRYRVSCDMTNDRFVDICESDEFFTNLYYYMTDYTLPYGDIKALRNLGLTMRNGEPTIVILDSGLTNEVLKKYY